MSLLGASMSRAGWRRTATVLLGLALAMTAALTVARAQAPAWSGTIRVALVERAPAAELRGIDIEVAGLLTCPGCRPETWAADGGRPATMRRTGSLRALPSHGFSLEIEGRRAAGFRLTSERPIRWNGREYPSPLEVLRNGDGIAVVNEVALEEYLVGVLRAETGDRFPLEALRAQAIVARTYAAYHRLLSAGKPYHIIASTAHQQYAGRVASGSVLWSAVSDTAGQVLRWEGELFPAFYHTESGGYTEDPRTVFAARNLPGLPAVHCPFSAGSPHFYWSLDLRLADLAEMLRRADINLGMVTALDVSERTASLRATWVTVHGSRGSARLRGNDLRRIVGYDALKSTLFAVDLDGDTARFTGRGYGHGIGMCQWGAKGMAEQGFTARQIVEFFYPGVALGVLDGPER